MNVKNKKCIFRLSYRSLRAAKNRNIIAVIAIILTTILFTSLFTIALSLNDSYQTYSFRQIGGYSHGTFKDVTDEQADKLITHSKIKAYGKRTCIGSIKSDYFGQISGEVSYMDENCSKWSYATPTTGRNPENSDEIAMDTTALKLLGAKAKLGTKIKLTYTVSDNKSKTFEKTDSFKLTGYYDYNSLMPVHYINVSKKYTENIIKEAKKNGLDDFRTDLNVMLKSSHNIEKQMEQIDKDFGYDWQTRDEKNSVRIGVNWGYTSEKVAENTDPVTLVGIVAFLILVIFTGYLIIYNIFQISVTNDIHFYGLIKTIGVTPHQLRRIIYIHALLLCAIGIPIGLFIGYFSGITLFPAIISQTTLGTESTSISISPLIFVISILFSLLTVLMSCLRPGFIASKISPVEAVKYTDNSNTKKKKKHTRGAKVYQMAFTNLGRNKLSTFLVVISLSLSVALLNTLFFFVNGIDMNRFVSRSVCSDFIVSTKSYFRYEIDGEHCISDKDIRRITANTDNKLTGCGYFLPSTDVVGWVDKKTYINMCKGTFSQKELQQNLNSIRKKGDKVASDPLIEGIDIKLLNKVKVFSGSISPLKDKKQHNIAISVMTDDYGNPQNIGIYPKVGDKFTMSYIDNAYFIDNRTGKKVTDDTPKKYMEYYIAKEHEVTYTVCALVKVPFSMGFRYGSVTGYNVVMSTDSLKNDSRQKISPLFYMLDSKNKKAEIRTENYLKNITSAPSSSLSFESKAKVRQEFDSFKNMFILLGGLLCAVIGIIGILNFVNAVLTGIMSRKHEFAMLKSIGMTNKQLRRMLIYESLFYSVSSSVVSLITSVIFVVLTKRLFENIFWFFNGHFVILPVLLVAPVFIILSCIIPMLMYGNTEKQSVVDTLRDFV